jgi:deoxyribodipyrimidine photo-lyase
VIQPERVRPLNRAAPAKGEFVLYWMQASQRARGNHALEYAAGRANELGKPLVAFFGLADRFPEANPRHYLFMLEGLAETASELEKRGVRLVVRRGSPGTGAAELGRRASLVVVDRGYLRVERGWRSEAARALDRPLIEVESNVIVPSETASPKEEYSAATFRPKIRRELDRFLVPPVRPRPRKDSLGLLIDSVDIRDPVRTLSILKFKKDIGPSRFHGGTSRALHILDDFVENRLDDYPEARNDPTLDGQSDLSPYLHFGQISPVEIALRVRDHGGPGVAAFLEELVVRRELSFNFVLHNTGYDAYEGLPEWSRATLARHAAVPREYSYSLEELEGARTHDPYWNAAQTEMVKTGKMHGYMRMYWGKKILEWSARPEEGFHAALVLNNKYELDGRDPNAFAGVAWCLGKHDRPWPERPIFGTVRYMNAAGLRRKFDADAYVRRVAGLAGALDPKP